ncbi:MAG: hypothetical protein AAFZ15_14905 [Bacteroidota bacterium]
MDLNYLLNILLRRKWLLLSVVFISTVATYYLIGQLPDTYKAESVIETGIINYQGPSLARDNGFIQQFQIDSDFSGLIEKMKSRTVIKKLTEALLAHDLLADGLSEKPFRIPEDMELTQTELDDIVLKLKANFNDSILSERPEPFRSDSRLAEAYGYDYESLMKKLAINRIAETDYVKVEFESESPALSHFVVNSFLQNFIKMHEEDLRKGEDKVLEFNEKKLAQVKEELDSMIKVINEYKTANGLVDVSTQRETVVSQKKELELKLQEVQGSIPSLQRNISFLEGEIFKYNKLTADEAYKQINYNDEFLATMNEITELQKDYVEAKANGSQNAEAIEKRIEELKNKQASTLSNALAIIPKSEKKQIDDKLKGLIQRHLDAKLELELALEAQRSYPKEISRLEGRANKLLQDDNTLYYMTQEKDRLDTEYDKIRREYEDSEYMAEGVDSPLDVVEPVEMPTEPESKNRAVFAVFAGIAGGSLTSILLFLLAFIDTSISIPSQFSRVTGLPLVGYVNKVKLKNVDLQKLFAQTQKKGDLEYFKESIRKIRTAIENSGAKTFLFVSPKASEGKSFLIVLLAYALSLNDRKVLIIDTNFKNNTLSAFKTKSFIEINTFGKAIIANSDFNRKALMSGAGEEPYDPNLKNIDIVGNKGGSQSPSEVLAGKNFDRIMAAYKKKYDFIFMESAAMNKFSDARELLPYTDKLAVVFSAESPMGNADNDTLDYLQGMNGKMFGGILNNVDMKNI